MKHIIYFVRGMFPIPIFLDTNSGVNLSPIFGISQIWRILKRHDFVWGEICTQKEGGHIWPFFDGIISDKSCRALQKKYKGWVGTGHGPLSWTLSEKKFFNRADFPWNFRKYSQAQGTLVNVNSLRTSTLTVIMSSETDPNASSLTPPSKHIVHMLTFLKWSLRVFEEQWIANNAYISALYPQLNFDVMKEIRALHMDVRTIDENHHVLIFRLPESDQVKSNMKRVTVDYGVFQKILEEDFYEQEMTMQVSSFWSNHIKRSIRGKVKTYLKLCHFGKFYA